MKMSKNKIEILKLANKNEYGTYQAKGQRMVDAAQKLVEMGFGRIIEESTRDHKNQLYWVVFKINKGE